MLLVFWVFVCFCWESLSHEAQSGLRFTYRLSAHHLHWLVVLPLPPKCPVYGVLRFKHKHSCMLGQHFSHLSSIPLAVLEIASPCVARDGLELTAIIPPPPAECCDYVSGCPTWCNWPFRNDWLAQCRKCASACSGTRRSHQQHSPGPTGHFIQKRPSPISFLF